MIRISDPLIDPDDLLRDYNQAGANREFTLEMEFLDWLVFLDILSISQQYVRFCVYPILKRG